MKSQPGGDFFSRLEMAITLAKTVTKLAVGFGAVYVTLDQGVWSSSNQGSKALDKVRTNVLPAANEYLIKGPNAEQINKELKSTWNAGIQTVFGGVSAAPAKLGEYSQGAVDQVKKSLQS